MISQKATLHNRFDFEIYDTKTGETEYAKAENIILDQMWSRLCNGQTYFSRIGVGKGTGTLSPTRTTLFSYLTNKEGTNVETVYDTDTTGHITKKVTFTETEAIGTWTEVGIMHSGTSTSDFVTHALITDSEGNIITIPKTNTKIVTIYATVFAELLPPVAGNLISAVRNKNAILRNMLNDTRTPAFLFTSLLKEDGSPSLIGATHLQSGGFNPDAANKRMYTNLTRLAATNGNAPIRGIILYDNGNADPSTRFGATTFPNSIFTKHDFLGIAVGTGDGATEEFDFPVSFIKSGSETIYVAGVAKTRNVDYTVRYGMRTADTLLVNLPDSRKWLIRTSGGVLEEIVLLPQPSGEEAIITSIEMKNSSTYNLRMTTYDIKLSLDGENWVDAGSAIAWSGSGVVTLNGFTPAAYKYMKANFTAASSGGALSYIKIYATPPSTKQIKFNTPPASGAAITTDFSVEYIPKSSNFVLDVQAEVVFGEKV